MRDAIRRWRRYRGLSPWERRTVSRAALWLPVTALALRLLGFRRCLRWLPGHTTADSGAERHLDGARRIARWVELAASRGWYGGNCLSRSMTLCRLLRSEDFPATLCIGVRKNGKDLEAHAWVECGGAVINDAPDVAERFTPLWRQPFDQNRMGGLPLRLPAYWRDAAGGQ